MNRQALDEHITATYKSCAEHLWLKHPTFAVYRHGENKKWFAVIMEIPNAKLGAPGSGEVGVVNLKCDPLLIGSLVCENGIHRAYHMNKNYWITVSLDGSVDEDKIKWLLDISFNLTHKKR